MVGRCQMETDDVGIQAIATKRYILTSISASSTVTRSKAPNDTPSFTDTYFVLGHCMMHCSTFWRCSHSRNWSCFSWSGMTLLPLGTSESLSLSRSVLRPLETFPPSLSVFLAALSGRYSRMHFLFSSSASRGRGALRLRGGPPISLLAACISSLFVIDVRSRRSNF